MVKVCRYGFGTGHLDEFEACKLTEDELLARDAKRDLNTELLDAIRQLQAGQIGRVSILTEDGHIIESPVAKARLRTRLSQSQFAALLGISVRTLQEWEQGRCSLTGAARTLLRVAETHSEILRELATQTKS